MSAFPLIDAAADDGRRAVLCFSAGKDSLALLLRLRECWDKLDVVWVNPGAPHVEVVAYMDRIRLRVPYFIEVKGMQPEWIARFGWPVDTLPARNSVVGALGFDKPKFLMQSFLTCCARNLWRPMQEYIGKSGASLVISGQRHEESLRNRLRDAEITVEGDVVYWHPLHSWTSADVLAYIAAQGEPPPPFYDIGAESSSDCWNCTAYLAHNKTRLKWMREKRPELFEQIAPVLQNLMEALDDDTGNIADIL